MWINKDELPDRLCGGGGGFNTPFICNIAEAALTCFILKGNKATVNQNVSAHAGQ